MKKRTAFVLAMVAMVLSCAGDSNAIVLGTIDRRAGSAASGKLTETFLSISYPLPGDFESISLSWNITEADVGETLFASADTHPNFDTFTRILTNGVDNLLFLIDIGILHIIDNDWPGAEVESSLINGIQGEVDFEGYMIDNISLTVNELFLDYDHSHTLVGPDGMTHYAYDITYTINGMETISNPEPATVMFLGLGCLAFRKRRKA